MSFEKFMDIADDGPYFRSWLEEVDMLCNRMLGIDLLSIPEAMEDPHYPLSNYEEGMSPNEYFCWLLESMKKNSSESEIDRQIARMVKWGDRWPASLV